MTYLKHIQEKNSSPIYEPEVKCNCGNELQGDSPTIFITDCDVCDDAELLSTCCGVGGLGNIHEYDGEYYGLCAKCKDHCEFEKEVE